MNNPELVFGSADDRRLFCPSGAPILSTRDGHNLFFEGAFRGRSVFLLCSGPSLTSNDLSKLDQRGIVTCSVNNAAAVYRTNLWVSYDDPPNFCDAIFRDPAITKFVPDHHLEDRIRVRDASGQLIESNDLVGDMPAIFGYRSNCSFKTENWLYEDSFNSGCSADLRDELGISGSRTVMLIAIRLLFYLGFRQVFLLGCDFRMTFGQSNYAFEQEQNRGTVRGNNSTYRALNARLTALLPHFEQANYKIFNCLKDSDLNVFPYMDFEQAVEIATESIPKEINTAGMYDRGWKKLCDDVDTSNE